MCNCQRAFEPSPQLEKSLFMIKIICVINVIVVILHIYPLNANIMMDILSCILIFLAYNSLLFYYSQIYILISCINLIFMIDSVGTFFQKVYASKVDTKTLTGVEYYSIGVNSFSLVFYVFAIAMVFSFYKEIRAQYYENAGVNFGDNVEQPANNNINGNENRAPWANNAINNNNYNNNNNNYNNNNNQQRGFVAFSGRGVRVGGN